MRLGWRESWRSRNGFGFCCLLSLIHNSLLLRADSMVIAGGKLGVAAQVILAPRILQVVERQRRAS